MTVQRCTCGFTKFTNRKVRASRTVSRWARHASPFIAAGVTPAGTSDTSGEPGPFGRYGIVQHYGALNVHCQSCGRLRRSYPLGGVTVFGGFRHMSYLYVIVADLVDQVSGLMLRIEGPEGASFDLPLSLAPDQLQGVPNEPLELVDSVAELPAGAVRATKVLRAHLPEIEVSGTYYPSVVEVGLEVVIPVPEFVVELEQEVGVQVLLPRDADLNGAPTPWLRSTTAMVPDAAQAGMAPNETIPFDKWTSFVEYDARAGTLPSTQGWSYGGSADVNDFSLIQASSMAMATAGASYWQKAVVLGAHPSEVHAYMVALRQTLPSSGNGLELLALGTSSGTDRFGVRLGMIRDNLRAVELDGSVGTSLTTNNPLGWEAFGGSAGDESVAWYRESGAKYDYAPPLALASSGPEMLVRFGDLEGDGIEAAVRNVVCSVGGRFIRASFATLAPNENPILRLYISREVRGTTDTTAYFKVRYTQSTNPYAAESTEVSVAVPATNANQIVEVPVQLAGLTAKRPFRFSLERVCGSGYDIFPGTMHFHYATVRSL